VDPELLDPDPAWTKNWKNTPEKVGFFSFKNCNLLIPRPPERTSKLQEKPSALNREHRALQKMKLFLNSIFLGHFFPWFRIRIRIANPDQDPGTHGIRIQIHNTGNKEIIYKSVKLTIPLFTDKYYMMC
jgi:hypothetical protein